MRPKEILNDVNRVKDEKMMSWATALRDSHESKDLLASCVCDRVWIGEFVYKIQILYRPLKKGYKVAAERRRLFV